MSAKNLIDADLYGFQSDCEGVPEELVTQFEQDDGERRVKSSISLGGISIDTSYPCNTGNYSTGRTRALKRITIHYTGGTGSARANVRYYHSTPGIGASAHFFVGHASEKAKIYQSVDPKNTAWHAIGGNSDSIGIEVCCHNDTADKTASSPDWYFDEETVDALEKLVRALMAEYGIAVDGIDRHYDITGKICPAMWVHDEAEWEAFKERVAADEEVTEYKAIIQSHCNFSNPAGVFSLTDQSLWAKDLYRKWAGSYDVK